MLDDEEVSMEIHQNKQQIVLPKRIGETPDVPAADFPYGYRKALDATHTDIIILSEHKLNIKEFVGEYRIYHKHKDTKGTPVLTILIDIHIEDKTNRYFQRALD